MLPSKTDCGKFARTHKPGLIAPGRRALPFFPIQPYAPVLRVDPRGPGQDRPRSAPSAGVVAWPLRWMPIGPFYGIRRRDACILRLFACPPARKKGKLPTPWGKGIKFTVSG